MATDAPNSETAIAATANRFIEVSLIIRPWEERAPNELKDD
jgi:hypothetical protein